jgi:hypothetical protein
MVQQFRLEGLTQLSLLANVIKCQHDYVSIGQQTLSNNQCDIKVRMTARLILLHHSPT